MRFSKRCNYALKIVLDLSHHYSHYPVHISDLYKRQNIPRKYIEHILLHLKKGGLVKSKKGPHGGYSLTRSPAEIMVGHVFRLAESSLALHPRDEHEILTDKADVIRNGFFGVFAEVDAAISSVIDNIDFKEILKREAEILTTDSEAFTFDI